MHTIYKSLSDKQVIQHYYETYLQTFEIEFERHDVATRFGKTHVLAAGPKDAQPLFILQGGNCISPMTLSWFLPLLKKYRVYAPDTIGHPGYSDEARVSGRDNSYGLWICDLMDFFNLKKSAFIGPSFGGGIILRLAAFFPERISCSVLVAPAGICLGSKRTMIRDILLPMIRYKVTSNQKYLTAITNTMSLSSMKSIDQEMIGELFKRVKLENKMPKLTKHKELVHYVAPTLLISGEKDPFFPSEKVTVQAEKIIPYLVDCKTYPISHFPDDEHTRKMNEAITAFLDKYYI
ncbi:alpha/beta hydrolase [Priestia megaterium]|nr:alpha/beta hydrolase [Priestia megaterium]